MSRITPAKQAIRDEYEFMLAQAHVNGWEDKIPCLEEPGKFSDYHRSPPQEEAAAMCAGCPLLKEICNPYAVAFPPAGGVLGGVAWYEKKPFVSAAELALAV